MTLTTSRVQISVSGSLTSIRDLQSASYPLSTTYTKNFAAGTGTDQCDLELDDTRTLGASATEDFDLNAVQTDPFGGIISFLKIKMLYVSALAANTNNVIVGGAAANGWQGPFGNVNDTVAIKPGGVLCWADGAGWPVVAGTADLLKFANSAGSTAVTFTVILLGTTV